MPIASLFADTSDVDVAFAVSIDGAYEGCDSSDDSKTDDLPLLRRYAADISEDADDNACGEADLNEVHSLCG